jgi:hypothetical protein
MSFGRRVARVDHIDRCAQSRARCFAVGVIVLGGSRDLSEQSPKEAGYIRVFVKSYPK